MTSPPFGSFAIGWHVEMVLALEAIAVTNATHDANHRLRIECWRIRLIEG